MPKLTDSNCSVDKESGAVMFHKSPELLEIIQLRQEVKDLNTTMNQILEILKGGKEDGTEVD